MDVQMDTLVNECTDGCMNVLMDSHMDVQMLEHLD